MVHKTKDLSPDQKTVIEGLLGRSVSLDEAISVRAVSADAAPRWLQDLWNSASRTGVNQISLEEIDIEITAARSERRQTIAQ